MKITILTLFPDIFTGPLNYSILRIAQEKKLLTFNLVNIRDFGIGRHKIVDDKPYGGGLGMILRVDVLDRAIESVKDTKLNTSEQRVVLLSAHGSSFNQKKAYSFSRLSHLILICGHYEGFDARVREKIDEEVSVGHFITTGGEIPSMLVTDAVSRLIPGVLKEEATKFESYSPDLEDSPQESYLEYPQYTRPNIYKNSPVPEILLSGNHKNIVAWRKSKSLKMKNSS